MYTKSLLVTAALSVLAQAQCPAVWGSVASDLKGRFAGCNADTRAAIRLPFHDCFPGACDGSIILSDECTTRSDNIQLVPICGILGDVANQYAVGVADLIQVAAAIAVASCPPAPSISVKIGRQDSSTANPPNQLPSQTDTATELVAMFAAKGFSSQDLVALVGAHSAGSDLGGTPFDKTETSLDSPTFYGEVLDGTAPTTLFSDHSLATTNATASNWEEYAGNQNSWNADFATALEKMSMMGVQNSSMVDCTSTIFG